MRLEPVAFWFWAMVVVRFSFAFLFFQDRPKMATFLEGLISVTFAFVLAVLKLSSDSASHRFPWPKVVKWVTLYITWAGLSLTWTFSDTFVSAVGYWVFMVLDLAIVMAMLRWGDVEQISLASFRGWIAGTFIIDAIAILFSSGDEYGRLGNPDFLHPGNLGHFTAVATLFSIFLWQQAREGSRSRHGWGLSAVLLCWILILTLSKTSLVGFVVAATVLLFVGSTLTLRVKLRALVVAMALALAGFGPVSNYVGGYVNDNEDPNAAVTLTGRTVLWTQSLEMIVDRPVMGYGFLSFRNYGPQDWDMRTVHGHNEWITQAFQLGFVGMLLSLMVYIAYYKQFRTVDEPLKRRLGISLLIYMLIEGMAIAEPVGLMFPLPLIILTTTWASISSRPAPVSAGSLWEEEV